MKEALSGRSEDYLRRLHEIIERKGTHALFITAFEIVFAILIGGVAFRLSTYPTDIHE